ncbi:MAG TPA: SDR family NAD(P)-dependent oxidoreductase, partial [Bacteroidia bacterium]|nr:SDR family NAD(P)-dependent oxidoreductase [Bacteroidia bacterium]
MKTTLITGATAGIGEACVHLLAQNGYRIIATGRRADRLEKLAADLKDKYKAEVLTLCFDVRNRAAVENAINSLPAEWQKIDLLVNNAGLAMGLSSVEEGNPDHWDSMIDTNIKGLLYVSRAVLPLMIRENTGHIINISSIAGKEIYNMGNVYCATKHAVDALTRSMRLDLAKYPIKVSMVCPGAVETEFSIVRFEGDVERAKKVYLGFENLVAEDVAEAVWFIASRPPNV